MLIIYVWIVPWQRWIVVHTTHFFFHVSETRNYLIYCFRSAALFHCLLDRRPSPLSIFPQKVEGGEEDDEAMGRKKTRKQDEGEEEANIEMQLWEIRRKKAGEESSVYKCFQSIQAWGSHAPHHWQSLLRGVRSKRQKGAVQGGKWGVSSSSPKPRFLTPIPDS